MAFDFIHGTISTYGTIIPGGAVPFQPAATASTYPGITGMAVATAVTTSFTAGGTLNLGAKLFFVNGLLVSSSA